MEISENSYVHTKKRIHFINYKFETIALEKYIFKRNFKLITIK